MAREIFLAHTAVALQMAKPARVMKNQVWVNKRTLLNVLGGHAA